MRERLHVRGAGGGKGGRKGGELAGRGGVRLKLSVDHKSLCRLDIAQLFSQVEGTFILPRLLPLLIASAEVRSAAERAALASLWGPPRARRDAAAGIALLLDLSRDLPHLNVGEVGERGREGDGQAVIPMHPGWWHPPPL